MSNLERMNQFLTLPPILGIVKMRRSDLKISLVPKKISQT
jgi:hypothetical protein